MQPRQAGNRHVKPRGARCGMIVYGLVTIAVIVSIVGTVMSWSTMVEKKLINRPAPGHNGPRLNPP